MRRCQLFVLVLLMTVFTRNSPVAVLASEQHTSDMTEPLLDQLEVADMERFLEQQEETDELQIDFVKMIRQMIAGERPFDMNEITSWINESLIGTLSKQKGQLSQMIVLLLAFALLHGIGAIFDRPILSDISFIAVYFLFLYESLQVFSTMQQTVAACMERIGQFTLIVQPIFCMAAIFSNGAGSAGMVYEMMLLAIYLIEHVMERVLLPFVFVYLITELANHAWKDHHLSSMSNLIESGIQISQKLMLTFVLGMNLIQGMIAPAVDELKKTAAAGAVSSIPGVGQLLNGTGQILLGTGVLIKNGVGVTALILLLILCAKPMIEIAVVSFIYRLLAACTEPITDRRISGALSALANAGFLYLRIIGTGMILLFLTIAILCVSTTIAH
ncbi:MAG: stage III sporulation protein AE [bacterium]|nr:stage III sporulation protein AE [bacterium]